MVRVYKVWHPRYRSFRESVCQRKLMKLLYVSFNTYFVVLTCGLIGQGSTMY